MLRLLWLKVSGKESSSRFAAASTMSVIMVLNLFEQWSWSQVCVQELLIEAYVAVDNT